MGKVFRSHGADQERIITLVLVLLAFVVMALALCRPLNPELCRYSIVGLVIAGFVWLVVIKSTGRLLSLLLCALIGLGILVPAPYHAPAAIALFLLFLLLTRASILDAMLPIRAFLIRRRAERK